MKFEDKLKEYISNNFGKKLYEEHVKSSKQFGLKYESYEEYIEKLFNQRINCGGYALELDVCVFNFLMRDDYDFDKLVSTLLEKLSFIRLLGDTKLEDDEYVVIYRARNDGAHHFIKIKDGEITEKKSAEPVTKFIGWDEHYKDSNDAVFAVKKDHDIDYIENGEKEYSIGLDNNAGKNFEETIKEAILNKLTSFSYHGREYYFQTENGELIVCSEGMTVADILVDGGECIADIRYGLEDYVSNTKSKNFKEYKMYKEIVEQQDIQLT